MWLSACAYVGLVTRHSIDLPSRHFTHYTYSCIGVAPTLFFKRNMPLIHQCLLKTLGLGQWPWVMSNMLHASGNSHRKIPSKKYQMSRTRELFDIFGRAPLQVVTRSILHVVHDPGSPTLNQVNQPEPGINQRNHLMKLRNWFSDWLCYFLHLCHSHKHPIPSLCTLVGKVIIQALNYGISSIFLCYGNPSNPYNKVTISCILSNYYWHKRYKNFLHSQ